MYTYGRQGRFVVPVFNFLFGDGCLRDSGGTGAFRQSVQPRAGQDFLVKLYILFFRFFVRLVVVGLPVSGHVPAGLRATLLIVLDSLPAVGFRYRVTRIPGNVIRWRRRGGNRGAAFRRNFSRRTMVICCRTCNLASSWSSLAFIVQATESIECTKTKCDFIRSTVTLEF